MSQIKNKLTFNLILIFSVFALGAAYFIQHILGHKPCNLCLIERLPYIFAIITISLGFILKKFEKVIIIFLILIFVAATIVSFYHCQLEPLHFQYDSSWSIGWKPCSQKPFKS